MSKEQDQIFIQNFIIILVMLLGMIAIFVIIARTVGTNEVVIAKQRALVIAAETRPVGSVRLSGTADAGSGQTVAVSTNESADADMAPGQKLHDSLCVSCHGTGLPNVPQTGNADHWANRIAQGELLLYERAIKGFTGDSGMAMPPKGGNPSLSDDEVRAAVDYMIENSQ